MNILVTGRGSSGSWAIRGTQLGGAIGATVERNAERAQGFDLAVIVKKIRPEGLMVLRSARVPVVWDIVDAWPQPTGNAWDRTLCMDWLRSEVLRLQPAALVVSTAAMANDCAEFKLPVLVLPHHARPGQLLNPVRDRVQIVAYEGAEQYLGKWRALVERECLPLGWKFLIVDVMHQVSRLCDVDIVLGLRDCKGYAPMHWKSNVKLANAQGSGTPCVMNREQGYLDTAQLGVAWADDPVELKLCFKVLADWRMRRAAANNLHASQPKLEELANRYKVWLQSIC